MTKDYSMIQKLIVKEIERLEDLADSMSADKKCNISDAAFAATDVYNLKQEYQDLFGEPWYSFKE